MSNTKVAIEGNNVKRTKCFILENRYMTTLNMVEPSEEDRSVMKSMVVWHQGSSGTGDRKRGPVGV